MVKLIKWPGTALLAAAGVFLLSTGLLAEEKTPAPAAPPYDRGAAYRTSINPHEQINDEMEVLWETCLVCHTNVPDVEKEKSIKDVKIRFADEKDLNEVCFSCHKVKRHPGSEGISVTMSGFAAPDHLVVPSRDIYLNMRLSMKEVATMLPLDPKTGKVLCVTCHNPHEKGVLSGRADTGADTRMRLRTPGIDICQYCHRK